MFSVFSITRLSWLFKYFLWIPKNIRSPSVGGRPNTTLGLVCMLALLRCIICRQDHTKNRLSVYPRLAQNTRFSSYSCTWLYMLFLYWELGRYITLSPSYLVWVICATLFWLIQSPSVRSASLIPVNGFHRLLLISVSSLRSPGSCRVLSRLHCRSCSAHNAQLTCGTFNPTCSSHVSFFPWAGSLDQSHSAIIQPKYFKFSSSVSVLWDEVCTGF